MISIAFQRSQTMHQRYIFVFFPIHTNTSGIGIYIMLFMIIRIKAVS